ncbi:MAG: hypothetical protein QXD13_01975 [Candidatus Pacearchaeota archaeon]
MTEKLEEIAEKEAEKISVFRKSARFLGKKAKLITGVAAGTAYFLVTGVFDSRVNLYEQARFFLSSMRLY